jgi:hypothetical protein
MYGNEFFLRETKVLILAALVGKRHEIPHGLLLRLGRGTRYPLVDLVEQLDHPVKVDVEAQVAAALLKFKGAPSKEGSL